MATTRKRSTTTRRRTSRSSSPLDDILGGITGTSTRRRSRKPTIGSITGGKAASGSILLTLAAICFAVGYYVPNFEWLIYVGIGIGVIYLIVAYIKNRKKTKKDETPVAEQTTAAQAATPASREDEEEPHLSASQRAQICDRLKTLPELQPLHPRLSDAAKLVVHQRTASTAVLVSMLKLNDSDAAAVLRQLELIGVIGPEQPDGTHSVYVTGDAELSEWLNLIFES